MAIMSYETWMSDTKRGLFTPRSAELREIDGAFESYDDTKTRVKLINLKTAFAKWMKTKPDWRASTRNKYGTVELVLRQIMDDLGGPGMFPEAQRIVLAPQVPLVPRPPARMNFDGPRPSGQGEIKMVKVREAYARLVGLVERCRDASANIDRDPEEAARFRLWFDVGGDEARKVRVQQIFRNMYAAVKDENIRIRFDETEDAYAYVKPGDPKPLTIYICNDFFGGTGGDLKQRFLNSTDATVVTMLHECTHITWIGGTDDHVYGKIPCRALAFSNPQQAVDNADNYAFYSLSLIQSF